MTTSTSTFAASLRCFAAVSAAVPSSIALDAFGLEGGAHLEGLRLRYGLYMQFKQCNVM